MAMPSDWVHCLFTGSIIGENYESKHCWVNELLDSPARFLGGKHQILLHDIETAKKLSQCCWWAGFVCASHTDLDNLPNPIKNHLNSIASEIRNGTYKPQKLATASFSFVLRTAFRRIHERVNVQIYVNENTNVEELIIIHPDTPLRTTVAYVNQVPLDVLFVNDVPYYQLPEDDPRIILHPAYVESQHGALHSEACLDVDALRYLFQS